MEKLLYKGKTKDVYELDDGTYLLKFKDDVTGENGVFDPGSNTVGLSIDGAGRAGLRLTAMFFETMRRQRVPLPTHFISADIENATMTVKPAAAFGKGLEVICRFKATGSFIRRYGAYIKDGAALPSQFVEMTLKDDARGDPPISKEALDMLGILSYDEYYMLKKLAKTVAKNIHATLAGKGLDLYDIKLEFGRLKSDNSIALIDEISGGNMRAYKDGVYVEPLELEKLMLG
jgi:phosphoribosylaminoimidazole-succinocarboxamide synthase